MAQAPTVMSPSESVMLHRKPRTIILCFDGTSNEYGTHNTNVVKFYSLLKKDRTDEQICYYQAGLGTYFKPGVVSPLFRRFAAILDQALAWYLSTHVMDGYKFLMQNYIAGDKVCLFGFSRGAYTARALAGMIHKVGLLLKDNEAQLPFAYKVYAAEDPDASQLAAGFKRTFCRAVPIEFIGVWDTVSSVGLFARKTLPFVTTNTTIKTFRQALALDERRAKFRANYYHRPVQSVTLTQSRAATFVKDAKKRLHKLKGGRSLRISDKILKDLPVVDLADDSIFTTDAKDVWFIGGHGDVGGGVSADGDDFALSDVPLRWMVRQAIRAQCGIQFDNTALSLLNIPLSVANIFQTVPASDGGQQRTLHDFMRRSMSTTATDDSSSVDDIVVEGPDIERNVREIEQPIYDALSDHKSWWLLEIIPTKYTWQRTTTNEWVSEWSMHLGEGRGIPGDPLFHESVKRRMENEKIKYKPRARWTGNVTWVD